MITNYFKLALRNLIKFKGYAGINIFGLAIGIACCLLIVQYIRSEFKHDSHHVNVERLYRIGTHFNIAGTESTTATTPSPLAYTLVQDYPEVEAAARLLRAPNTTQYLVKYGDQSFFEPGGLLADSTFFRIMTYDFIEGDSETALDAPFNVVISKEVAAKLFGNTKALNKTIKISDQYGENDYKVTGVFDHEAYASHLTDHLYINIQSGPVGQYFYNLNEWAGNNLYYTYLRLSPNTSAEMLAAKLPALVEEKAGDRLRSFGFSKEHFLLPVKDIYLQSDAQLEPGQTSNSRTVYLFAIIAVFFVIISCINLMKHTTAKSTVRAKEGGVRKVIGASRSMLSGQFMAEAFVYTSMAVVLAYLLAEMALPYFNQLADTQISLNFINDKIVLVWMVGILIVTALLAGSYPALYLSSFSPIKIFRDRAGGDRFSAQQVRKLLVVAQFIVSIALIQGILVIQQQMKYLQQKELGFNPEAKLVVPLNTTNAAQQYKLLKESFLQEADVQEVSATTAAPGLPNIEDFLVYGEGQSSETSFRATRNWIDPGYLSMMDFELVAGRTFDLSRIADTVGSVVINESLVADLGYTLENVIGKKMFWNFGPSSSTLNTHQIIGVVKDFHSASLREELDNHAFQWDLNYQPGQLVATVATADLPSLIPQLERKWLTANPGEPFSYFFLDDKLQQAYQSDQRTAGLIFSFAMLAIFISCLGLFGLAAFAAENRKKEIGVRKVLGASTTGIIRLLSKDFLILVTVAILVASPLAYYFMNLWLQDFAYSIDIPWWVFVVAGLVAILIAFVTVSFQTVRAAWVNPVESLKGSE